MSLLDKLPFMSSRELDKVLEEKNREKAKLFYNDNNVLVEKLAEVKEENIVIYKTSGNFITTSTSSRGNFYQNHSPLTRQALIDAKAKSIRDKLDDVSISKLPKLLTSLVRTVIPEDRFDVVQTGDSVVELILYYPRITITNSMELSHEITDLYVRLVFGVVDTISRRANLATMQMLRGSMTIEEALDNYTHSHCSVINNENICVGKRTPMDVLRDSLKKGYFSSLIPFLLQLQSFLEWESLEGTPYTYISLLPDEVKKALENKRTTYLKRLPPEGREEVAGLVIAGLDTLEFHIEYNGINNRELVFPYSVSTKMLEGIRNSGLLPVQAVVKDTGAKAISFEDFYTKICNIKETLESQYTRYTFKGNPIKPEIRNSSIDELKELYDANVEEAISTIDIDLVFDTIKRKIIEFVEDETKERKDYTRED